MPHRLIQVVTFSQAQEAFCSANTSFAELIHMFKHNYYNTLIRASSLVTSTDQQPAHTHELSILIGLFLANSNTMVKFNLHGTIEIIASLSKGLKNA